MLLFVLPVLFLAFLLISICSALFYEYYQRRKCFIAESSHALKNLQMINEKFLFKSVPNLNMENNYDNEHFYEEISPKDYLTYQLVRKQTEVLQAIASAEENCALYHEYKKEIDSSCHFNSFENGTVAVTQNKSWLEQKLVNYWLGKGRAGIIELEKELFFNQLQRPTQILCITVRLWKTNIHGRRYTYKENAFFAPEIKIIIERLNQKSGTFYRDYNIWQSLCRVERGRVTNRVRFAIYKRDGYRCRQCGNTNDLEIDHIYPISKGGTSDFYNLQTLCHRCNFQKSNTVPYNRYGARR